MEIIKRLNRLREIYKERMRIKSRSETADTSTSYLMTANDPVDIRHRPSSSNVASDRR